MKHRERMLGNDHEWEDVAPGAEVVLRHEKLPQHNGKVDTVSADGTLVWVVDNLGDRRLFHRNDGYKLMCLTPAL